MEVIWIRSFNRIYPGGSLRASSVPVIYSLNAVAGRLIVLLRYQIKSPTWRQKCVANRGRPSGASSHWLSDLLWPRDL